MSCDTISIDSLFFFLHQDMITLEYRDIAQGFIRLATVWRLGEVVRIVT